MALKLDIINNPIDWDAHFLSMSNEEKKRLIIEEKLTLEAVIEDWKREGREGADE